jgi:hypothetical protein
MQLRELFKKDNNTAVLAFGRMNPITIGHNKLAETIKSIPGDGYIFLSHKQNSKTDPLNFETKLKFAKECFPGITVGDSSVRTIIEAIKKVNSLGYTELVYVAGADRVDEFTKLLNAYNNKEYSFESITVVNAGQRDPDADGVEGISASKLREAAVNNDVNTFLAGTPLNKFSLEMFNAVRNSMIENNNLKKNDLMSAFEKFFPIAMKVLDIDKLPKIKLEKYLDHLDQPSFGRFANKEVTIHLGVKDRHPIDILRTLAHELVHFKQLLNNELDKDSGNTGSPEENKAHITAGVIMRMFNKKYPEYFKSSVVESNSFTDARMNAIKAGKKEFTVNGKTYKVTVDTSDEENAVANENFAESSALFTFKIKRRKLNVPALIKAGAIFITYPHGEQGWETNDKQVWSYSLISLYNVQSGGWPKDAKNYLKPQSYKRAEQQINSSAPNLGSDQLVYDGKYNQILWSIKKLGIPDNVAFLDNSQQDVAENFADGKNPGRKGLAKRMGVNTTASVSSLRKTAKNSSGEKQRMAHWLANMKAGREK